MIEQMSRRADRDVGATSQGFSLRLNEQQRQLATLQSTARTAGDERLNQLIAELDEKLALARSKLNDMKKAEEGRVPGAQRELKGIMTEAQELIVQAMARTGELTDKLPGGINPGRD